MKWKWCKNVTDSNLNRKFAENHMNISNKDLFYFEYYEIIIAVGAYSNLHCTIGLGFDYVLTLIIDYLIIPSYVLFLFYLNIFHCIFQMINMWHSRQENKHYYCHLFSGWINTVDTVVIKYSKEIILIYINRRYFSTIISHNQFELMISYIRIGETT